MRLALNRVARELHVSRRTLFRWIQAGLPSELIAGERYLDIEQARAWKQWKGLTNPRQQHARATALAAGDRDARLSLAAATRVFTEWLEAGGLAAVERLGDVLDDTARRGLVDVLVKLGDGDAVTVQAVIAGVPQPPVPARVTHLAGDLYASTGHLLVTRDGYLGEQLLRGLIRISPGHPPAAIAPAPAGGSAAQSSAVRHAADSDILGVE